MSHPRRYATASRRAAGSRSAGGRSILRMTEGRCRRSSTARKRRRELRRPPSSRHATCAICRIPSASAWPSSSVRPLRERVVAEVVRCLPLQPPTHRAVAGEVGRHRSMKPPRWSRALHRSQSLGPRSQQLPRPHRLPLLDRFGVGCGGRIGGDRSRLNRCDLEERHGRSAAQARRQRRPDAACAPSP